jgi:hypothetical protein
MWLPEENRIPALLSTGCDCMMALALLPM